MVKPFATDHCTLVKDYDQNKCCVKRDWAYWKRGTFQERWEADSQFLECIKGTSSKFLAPFRWSGVRVGGMGFLPTGSRWGYGRNWPRSKAPHNDNSKFDEENQRGTFDEKLAEARAANELYRQKKKARNAAAGQPSGVGP